MSVPPVLIMAGGTGGHVFPALALARLLVTDATLWILDEPFTSLDVHGIRVIEELLEAHTQRGGMLAVTSHHAVNLHRTTVHRINLSA